MSALGQISACVISGAIGFVINYAISKIFLRETPQSRAQGQAKKRMKQIGMQNVELSEHEMIIAAHLVDPLSIETTWSDVAGLDDVITELKNSVIRSIQQRNLTENSKLLQPPKGVLLYGPPGCGQSLIAKATAREAGFCFINLQPSTLTDKLYGETQKLTAAVFSLASKIQPCIIFIDEIDSFLRTRPSTDNEATAVMKTEFLSLWDGLETGCNRQVIIMGATNRRQDLDPAVLHRMPTQLHIKQPNIIQRESILRLILKNENMGSCVDLHEIAKDTDGFSGSDLKEMCRNAALLCLQDSKDSSEEDNIRPIQQTDLKNSLKRRRNSKSIEAPTMLMDIALE